MTGYSDFYPHKPETQSIINAHAKDFDYNTVNEFLKKKGGYKAYVRSLGGVFTKWIDFEGKITTAEELSEVGDYVWGLYDIWGVDYSNGCSYTFSENRYKAKDGCVGAFYPSENPSVRFDMNYAAFSFKNGDDLPGVDEMLSNSKYYAVTNCGQGVVQTLKKAGLIPKSFPDPAEYPRYYKEHGYGYKVIRKASDLQIGDVLYFFNKEIDRNINDLPNWMSGGFHTAIVGERTNSHIYLYDSGHAYTYYGEFRNRRKIGDDNVYQWAVDWIGIRLDVVAKLKKTDMGWICKAGKWYYYKDGKPVKGWQKLEWTKGTDWFWFDDDGVMTTGWKQIYWKGANHWFFFNSSGAMQTGWKQITYKGKKCWFYFESTGVMVTGLRQLKWKDAWGWYLFDKDGVMQTGNHSVRMEFGNTGLTGGIKL